MKKDKLTLRSEIQTDFNNESVGNLNKAITIAKIVRFIYKESTIFFLSMIPFLAVSIFYLMKDMPSIGVVLMLVHYPFYKIFVKRIFKDAKDTYDEFNYTIEVMNDIKEEKLK